MPSSEPPCPEKKPVESRYANYFEIGFNSHEIVINCSQYYAGDAEPRVVSRIVTSPPYAQWLLELLQKTLQEHEFQYGSTKQD